MPVILGTDILFQKELLKGRRIGLVCNPASVDAGFRHVIDRATGAGVTIGALFGPQHGIRSDVQENMIESPHERDVRRSVPVYSLYSDTREPTPDMLDGLDALVIDLQDVGTRIYTYIYTMAYCLRAAGRAGLPVIVCDRPNPIGGVAVEGPMLEAGFESFVGLFPIPMRHGMTIGELAHFFNETQRLGAKLEVVPMQGWSREMYFDETGLPFVLPSPNIPTVASEVVYPGTVLFEGVNVSEGRGTTKPFELLGAPWVKDAEAFVSGLNALGLPGTTFRPHSFEPTFHKHAKVLCGGCQVHVTDRRSFRSVETGVAAVKAFHDADPSAFGWREGPYEYEYRLPPIDILYGSGELRAAIAHGRSAREIADGWTGAVRAFEQARAAYLLY
ncbi:MAG: DUF1343 domain-containing protein [Acidobacteriota bacterium]|nr:DUF1343 domain-containing protein [Acidobacteriota bacterium]